MAAGVLPRVLAAAAYAWMTETTYNNLLLLRKARERQGQTLPNLEEIVKYLADRTEELKGEKN